MKKFIEAILTFIGGEVHEIKVLIGEYGVKAVAILEQLKALVNNPEADLVVGLTATKWDDEILAGLRFALDNLLPNPMPTDANFQEVLAGYLKELQGSSGAARAAIYLKIASLLIQHFAAKNGETISASEADTIAQISYLQTKQGND